MSVDDVKLSPCPFCGNADEPVVWDMDYHEQEYQEHDIRYTVVCDRSRNGSNDVHSGCGADCGSYETPAKAIEAWSRRAQLAPQWIPVMRECREHVAEMIAIFGPCDHDAGLCICGDKSLLASIDEVLPPTTEPKP
jgi:hypothetical protein